MSSGPTSPLVNTDQMSFTCSASHQKNKAPLVPRGGPDTQATNWNLPRKCDTETPRCVVWTLRPGIAFHGASEAKTRRSPWLLSFSHPQCPISPHGLLDLPWNISWILFISPHCHCHHAGPSHNHVLPSSALLWWVQSQGQLEWSFRSANKTSPSLAQTLWCLVFSLL